MTVIQNVDDVYVAGDYLDLVVSVVDGDGAAVDITNVEDILYGIFKTDAGGGPLGAAVVTKSLLSGIAITDGAGGVFTVTLDNGDTGLLRGNYYHEAEITDENSRVVTVFIGQIVITAQGHLP